MIEIAKAELEELRLAQDQINRLEFYRNQFLRFLARKYEIDNGSYKFDFDKGAFVENGQQS